MKSILLLHGWNYRNYTSQTKNTDAWQNRIDFVNELSKNFLIYKINFPGFCGEEEPNKAWNLFDYVKYVDNYIKENNLKVDYILGYSFGGAVATLYNKIIDNNQKIILVSPAIIRNNKNSKKFIKTPKLLNPVRNIIRNFYVIHIKKTNEMVYGTKFLRKSYQNIVRVELLNEIKTINPSNVTIIYGELDNMVMPNKVITELKETKIPIKIIKGGGHDIATTNTSELIRIIKGVK